jgi:hypothetical protein
MELINLLSARHRFETNGGGSYAFWDVRVGYANNKLDGIVG